MAYNVFSHFYKTSVKELLYMYKILTKTEYNLYLLLGSLCEENKNIENFTDSALAKKLNLSLSSIANAKTGLKQKEYALIFWFKDEKNKPALRIILGKENIKLYNLDLTVQITDTKPYNEVIKKYDLFNPKHTIQQREEIIKEINKEYKNK